MTCDCIEKIIREALKGQQGNNPKVTEVQFMDICWTMDGTFTTSDLKVIADKGKNKTVKIIHAFCPFCGKPEEVK